MGYDIVRQTVTRRYGGVVDVSLTTYYGEKRTYALHGVL